MHIPDGFIDAPTSAAAAVVAVGGVGVSLRRAGEVLEDKEAPLAGLVAAFIFAVQMLNFPVAGGTSGHLLGGVLAAVLVGPWLGALCVSVVLVVQALLFADGGLSALGLNIVNMALVGAIGGYGLYLLARRVLPTTRGGVVAASATAALLSVVLASLAFTLEYAIGGAGGASLGRVATAMIGTHFLIGIGEAVITGLTVSAVLAVRPDLVYGARDVPLETVTARPVTVGG
jgi:cobalt/nickel transport system permease protein